MIDLYYWPDIPGRGEYVRLVLEAGGLKYRDVVRLPEAEGGGMPAMVAFLEGRKGYPIPFAPPFIVDDGILVSQTALCCAHVAAQCGLAPEAEADRAFALSVAVTTADFAAEAHDTHHPISVSLYYEDQKPEAMRRAEDFRNNRIPKFLAWYENLIENNPTDSGWLVGDRMTYADLGLFHTCRGLAYAFPNAMGEASQAAPKVQELCRTIAKLPKVIAYQGSDRALRFSTDGLFRRYPELDPASGGQ
ncbi:putative glutathione S-transferase P subunit [Fulvimarina pelagi HTCC2506]|uniref:Putative glutathione S-transferase P subunit n=1 Tax=Fulvimarina pelagi HTCC2506 TaxID=314231 RepID=Q0G3P8_9HYPH|nr:putative glutathione S-transferase P subunit [Fulvimarina pelagi HTCC2506]